jgi:ABC-type lipoprotein release transport system permease subunit
MSLGSLWIMGYRDLLRNRRRSLFSLLAVGLGLALLMTINGLISGMMEDSLQSSIRLLTGHVQIRAATYQEEKLSLAAKDMLSNSAAQAARLIGNPDVSAATPVLWTGGILNSNDQSANVRLVGADFTSPFYDPVRASIVAGQIPGPEERGVIVLGKRLADDMGLAVGQRISLSIVDSDGRPTDGVFLIRGLFLSGIPSYDQSTVMMPLASAQAFVNVGDRASAIIVLLHDGSKADSLAAAWKMEGQSVLSWKELNSVFLSLMDVGMSYYALIDGIVMMVVAVIIANTMLMVVFERVREIGILAALGMKKRQLMTMYLLEAILLGAAGIAAGFVLGSLGVAYLSAVGIPIGDVGKAVQGMALGTVMRARFALDVFAKLSAWTFGLILLASLYPAWFAAHLEPVDALHA